MVNRFKIVFSVLLLCFVVGCMGHIGSGPQKIDLPPYKPSKKPWRYITERENLFVAVSADNIPKTSNGLYLIGRKNGRYDVDAEQIYTADDLSAWIGDAFKKELTPLGYNVQFCTKHGVADKEVGIRVEVLKIDQYGEGLKGDVSRRVTIIDLQFSILRNGRTVESFKKSSEGALNYSILSSMLRFEKTSEKSIRLTMGSLVKQSMDSLAAILRPHSIYKYTPEWYGAKPITSNDLELLCAYYLRQEMKANRNIDGIIEKYILSFNDSYDQYKISLLSKIILKTIFTVFNFR